MEVVNNVKTIAFGNKETKIQIRKWDSRFY